VQKAQNAATSANRGQGARAGNAMAPRTYSQMPRALQSAPTNVTMDNAAETLPGWAKGGGVPGFKLPATPGNMPGGGMGTGSVDLPGEGYDPNPDSRTNEEMINDLVRQYLAGGPADTAEQEALIKKQIEQELGMDLMNQRAAAWSSGIEASGALIGAEGDIRRGANMDATEQILGARSKAEEDAFERAMQAAGLDRQERQMAIDERMRQLQLDALNAWVESQGGEIADSGGADPGGAIAGLLDPDGNGVSQVPGFNQGPSQELANADDVEITDEMGASATEASSAPGTYGRTATWVDNGGSVWNMYETENGWVKVRAEGAATLAG
jgi:hypothetical protein